MKRQGPGRPKGSTNIDVLVQVEPSRCPSCGSSQRTKYENTSYRDYSGAGLPFIGIYYRSCQCADCGQARRDQEKVYAPKETAFGDHLSSARSASTSVITAGHPLQYDRQSIIDPAQLSN